MSGICGIVNGGGAPVDRQLLQKMTAFMAFRGPDAQDIMIDGLAGLGHTLLRTTFESENEHQPLSLDGKVWITADARIDGQAELKKKLETRGRTALTAANDAELILHAYHAWGEDCVHYLIGDFAFAIWDTARERLFCARDHFGVKPFFYARTRDGLAFSNTLDCLRQDPAISDTLDELWIADFLLFELSQDPSATVFLNIRRLPPAHRLFFSRDALRIDKFWSLPTDLGVTYRDKGDYVEHFKSLLETAVADRLRSNRIGVEMTGGMDSSSLAAVAKQMLQRTGSPFELSAHTVVYDQLIPDRERHYASLVANQLGIAIHFAIADGYELFAHSDRPLPPIPEPSHEPTAMVAADHFCDVAKHCRIALSGWDGDALLSESPKPFLRHLWRQRKFGRLLFGLLGYAVSERRVVPQGLSNRLFRRGTDNQPDMPYPDWVAPEFERRLDLPARSKKFQSRPNVTNELRPYAHRSYEFITSLSNFFEYYDAGVTGVPLEFRHPLMDLRLLEYCLSLPPWPWCVKKHILREAMRGLLPEPVRTRPKTSLAGRPWIERLKLGDAERLDAFVASKSLKRYVDSCRIPPFREAANLDDVWMNLRPHSLDLWLRRMRSAGNGNV
jgi:asparagine synthase (glutamine-hydrolysing)